MAAQARAPITARPITRRSSSIPTATMSRRFARRPFDACSCHRHCEERKRRSFLRCPMDCFASLAMTTSAETNAFTHIRRTSTMASIHKDIIIDAGVNDVWDAVRDFGAVHQRLVPGFVLDSRLDGDARIVTFSNGMVARELLVDCDDARRRLVYAVVSERVKQHSASVQVTAEADGRSVLAWTVDVLPHEIAPYMNAQMDQAALAMQKALGRKAA